jgi:hypothetical protein
MITFANAMGLCFGNPNDVSDVEGHNNKSRNDACNKQFANG